MTTFDVPWWLCREGDDYGLILDPEITEWCAENLSVQPVVNLLLTSEWNADFTGLSQHYQGTISFEHVDDALFFKIKWL
ncbi:MAG: hypothetical protein EOO77_17100 [Oxalobacteraceae bacterium]|nr:MAG: hypothetical protein EOO77_17100 [Oxalobacteraceae bacterium]